MAWNDYVRLCNEGGKRSFPELVELADLKSPFEDGCLEGVVNKVGGWLDGVDIKGK